MADFVQTMKDWKRMCNAMGYEDEYSACEKCPLKGFGCPAIYEKECDGINWDFIEKEVTKWAAEHPEPVYPTWENWLTSLGVQTYNELSNPIPAHIARRFGIIPKESDRDGTVF